MWPPRWAFRPGDAAAAGRRRESMEHAVADVGGERGAPHGDEPEVQWRYAVEEAFARPVAEWLSRGLARTGSVAVRRDRDVAEDLVGHGAFRPRHYCLPSAIKVNSRCLVSRDLHDASVRDIPLPPRWHGGAPPARKKPGNRPAARVSACRLTCAFALCHGREFPLCRFADVMALRRAAVTAPNALPLITAFPRVSRKRAIWSTWRVFGLNVRTA